MHEVQGHAGLAQNGMQEDQHGKDIHTQLDNMQHQLETKLKVRQKKLAT